MRDAANCLDGLAERVLARVPVELLAAASRCAVNGLHT
jgi:hypothetical protein